MVFFENFLPLHSIKLKAPSSFIGMTLPEVAFNALLKEVSKEKAWKALKFMKAFKAPRPDGFQHAIRDKVWAMVS